MSTCHDACSMNSDIHVASSHNRIVCPAMIVIHSPVQLWREQDSDAASSADERSDACSRDDGSDVDGDEQQSKKKLKGGKGGAAKKATATKPKKAAKGSANGSKKPAGKKAAGYKGKKAAPKGKGVKRKRGVRSLFPKLKPVLYGLCNCTPIRAAALRWRLSPLIDWYRVRQLKTYCRLLLVSSSDIVAALMLSACVSSGG